MMKIPASLLITSLVGICLITAGCAGPQRQTSNEPKPGEAPNSEAQAGDETHTKFGIFLAVNTDLNTPPGRVDLAHVQLAAKPVISADDIISYDLSTHSMKLRRKPLTGIPLAPGQLVRGVPFVVVANGQRIYVGAFTTEISSISFNVPTIVLGRFKTPDDVTVIDRGYPADSFGKGSDPRGDPRIENALAALHKLK